MALPKKYFKMFPGNLKKAWAAYRRDTGKRKTAAKATKRSPAKKSTSKGARRMPTKKRATAAARKVATKIRYRTKEIKPFDMMITALIAAGGGIVSSMVVNKTPGVKTLHPLAKSGAQIGTGLAVLYFGPKKYKIVKALGAGAFTAGVFGGAAKLTKQDVLAGDEELTNEEIQALLSSGVLPGGMNGPVELSGPVELGAGENPGFMGETQFNI